ncbi:sigma factor-like helix-turn-helix DNA-binding protein [Clostridium estertheticum]|uniref:sigma factor-like helix-turn-helix DNA-binding protein n=1 Tax=Clostridium estertheticum TaxID=238834 RepID=UPI001C6F2F93|nr:sigma factor-like helix-turn-helix DNA-binding protein [Clostridium estertheticum]MBW9151332.1 sigma-70 family RNA polymerase sigma factor [Clostridium estertheticum]WLC84692.1 sigma-70 family RNA polymerase sigma factor [Clostridium estertheticum]
MEKLVEKSKNGDSEATELIIGKFKYLIFKESSKYHIPGYTNEDLIQHGYCINAIKMNFKALLKGEIKHFREVPNSNMVDFDAQEHYEFTLEDEVIAYGEVEKLYVALNTLEPFERYILERFYIMGHSLTEIACTTDKSYYKYSRIKKKALEKLKAIM